MIMGMDPSPESSDHLNLETCVHSTFKVGPKDKEESTMYASQNYYILL